MTRALILLMAWAAFAQSNDPRPKFAVAEIHPSAPSQRPVRNGPFTHPDRYELRNASLVDMVSVAYGVDNDKVLGGPSWVEFDRFDIQAKAPAGAKADDYKVMLQQLLAERFGLTVHQDTKSFPTFALTAKNPHLKEAAEGSGGNNGCSFGMQGMPAVAAAAGGAPPMPTTMTMTVSCHGASMESFALNISGMVGPPVPGGPFVPIADKTELKGMYDIDLKVMIDPSSNSESDAFRNAIDKQLGLKLENIEEPMPVVSIDRANRQPTANTPDAAKSFPALPKEFDVASLKPSAPPAAGGRGGRGQTMQFDKAEVHGFPLHQLINLAWNLTNQDTVIGMPKWADTDMYDVIAKVPPEAAPVGRGPADMDVYRPMFQKLLIDRFQMKIHYEDRPVDAWALTANKPKLQKANPDGRTKWINGPGPDGKDPRKANPQLSRLVYFQNMTMAEFAALLPTVANGYIRTPVEDKTGLEGSYDFTLSFSNAGIVNGNVVMMGSGGAGFVTVVGGSGGGGGAGANASDPGGGLSLFDAIVKQLGLKLEPQKRSLPVLVIDHIEQKPTEN